MLQKNGENPHFIEKLFSTDEATFTRDGIFNSHNTHVWSDETPYALQKTHIQGRFNVDVWVVDPYTLPPRSTAAAYLDFLNNILGNLLEDVPLGTRRDMWYLHKRTSAHYACDVRA